MEQTQIENNFEFDCGKYALDDFSKARWDCDLYDVEISIGGKKFGANKGILSCRSPYWSSRLECPQPAYELRGGDVEAFELVLGYIYTGKMALSSLLEAARLHVFSNRFILQELNMEIIKYIETFISLDNVWPLLTLECITSEVKEICYHFMDAHADKAVQHERFLALPKDVVHEIIQSDSFCVNEYKLLKAVHKWKAKHPNDEAKSLLRLIRYKNMTEEQLEKVKNKYAIDEALLESQLKAKCSVRVQSKQTVTRKKKKECYFKAVSGFLMSSSEGVDPIALDYDASDGAFSFGGAYLSGLNLKDYDRCDVTLELPVEQIVNSIGLKLLNDESSSGQFTFLIAISTDRRNWRKVIDRTKDCVQGWQELFFERTPARYVKIVGTSWVNKGRSYFDSWMTYLKSSFKPKNIRVKCSEDPMPTVNTICVPVNENVLSSHWGTNLFIANQKITDSVILDSNSTFKEKFSNPCSLDISPVCDYNFIDLVLSQPFMLNEVQLHLWNGVPATYNYRLYLWDTHEEIYFDISEEEAASRRPPHSKNWMKIAEATSASGLQKIRFQLQKVAVFSVECIQPSRHSAATKFEIQSVTATATGQI